MDDRFDVRELTDQQIHDHICAQTARIDQVFAIIRDMYNAPDFPHKKLYELNSHDFKACKRVLHCMSREEIMAIRLFILHSYAMAQVSVCTDERDRRAES